MNEVGPSKKTVLFLFYLFVFFIFIDVPLVILYTITESASLVKIILYSSEFIIMIFFVYLLLNSFQTSLPVFIYVYVGYISSIIFVSLLLNFDYGVLKHSRSFLAPLPPLLLGYYFTLSFEEREKYIDRLIAFLTIMSVIGLIEWVCWYFLPYNSIAQFYSKYFKVGQYYHEIRHTSGITQEGILLASVRPLGFLIPNVSKRLTGLYLEPFSAGFNSTLAVILILYSRIAGYLEKRRNYIFLMINIISIVLTTSRSAYLVLAVSVVMYAIIQRNPFGALSLCLLAYFYNPLRDLIFTSATNLGGGYHLKGVLEFIDYFWNYFPSIKGLFGSGIGSMIGTEKWYLYVESGYGAIFLQLGILGLFMIFFLYLSIIAQVPFSKENKFFVLSISISTFALLFFSGYPFGYKTYGMIYLFLASIMNHD